MIIWPRPRPRHKTPRSTRPFPKYFQDHRSPSNKKDLSEDKDKDKDQDQDQVTDKNQDLAPDSDQELDLDLDLDQHLIIEELLVLMIMYYHTNV